MDQLGFITIVYTANFSRLVTLHRILSELYEHLSLLTSGDPRATIQQMIIKGGTSGNLTVAEDTHINTCIYMMPIACS